MITLKTLEWSNLFSYGEHSSISLDNSKITQLIGLNGHGKSSIPLILQEVLYNKNSKAIKKADIPNRTLKATKYSISLAFNIDEDEYLLKVQRTGATQKVYLEKNGEDISSHTATNTFKQLEELLGMSFNTFTQIVYQNNASSLQFLTATDAARKAFLIELLSLEKYTEIFEHIKSVYNDVATRIEVANGKVSTVSRWLNTHTENLQLQELLPEPEELDAGIREAIAEAQVILKDTEKYNSRIKANEEAKKSLESNRKALEAAAKAVEELVPPTPPVKPEGEELDTSKHSEELAVLRHTISTEQALLKKYTGVGSGTCPTCAQEINSELLNSLAEKTKRSIEAHKVSGLQIAEEFAKISAHNKVLENYRIEWQRYNSELLTQKNTVSRYERLKSDYDKFLALVDYELPSIQASSSETLAKIEALRKQITAHELETAKINKANSQILAHNAKVEQDKLLTAKYRAELEAAEAELKTIEDQYKVLEVLKKALSINGLLAYKLESSVKGLEDLTNEYLDKLSDGRFQLSFQLANEKLKVVIHDNGGAIGIEALSAGELSRVTTSTLLAIRKLMSSMSKNRINVLFLDETIDSLDSYGKEKLVEVLLEEEDLNTFLITHSYQHPLIDKLQIVKESGISRIKKW